MHSLRSLIARALLMGACLALPAAAGVIVVDVFGSGDATDIPAGVALANDGDVLLVKPGDYSGFAINGKSLHVIADGGDVTVDSAVRIRNLGAGQRVVLDEIDIVPAFTSIFSQPPALELSDCAGSVRVERCMILAASAPPPGQACEGSGTFWPRGSDAVSVSNCADVVLASCLLEGGTGQGSLNPLCFDRGSPGGRGLLVDGAHVNLHEVIARGADGMVDGNGGDGGDGVRVRGASDVLASGLQAEGGDGGPSTDFVGASGLTGNGGDGLHVEAAATVRLLGGAFTGGAAGAACCWVNDPGLASLIEGTRLDYAGSPHRLLTSSPTREGELLTLSITGAPGDNVLLLLGFVPALLDLPGFGGTLYLDPGAMLGPLPLVTLTFPLSNVNLPIPELGPGIDVATLEVQLLVVEFTGGAKVLTAPGQVVLLDAAL